jgi:hypothetical protein
MQAMSLYPGIQIQVKNLVFGGSTVFFHAHAMSQGKLGWDLEICRARRLRASSQGPHRNRDAIGSLSVLISPLIELVGELCERKVVGIIGERVFQFPTHLEG